jgi:hypothetical protein
MYTVSKPMVVQSPHAIATSATEVDAEIDIERDSDKENSV